MWSLANFILKSDFCYHTWWLLELALSNLLGTPWYIVLASKDTGQVYQIYK